VARFYANENFPLPAVEELRRLGNDVLTIQELLLPLEPDFGEQYEVVLGLGLAYYLQGELASAARFLEGAARIRPASTSLLNTLGDIYIRLERSGDARWVLERSLALDPAQEAIGKQVASLPESK